MNNSNKIKNDNKKAFPKFLLIAVLGMLLGAAISCFAQLSSARSANEVTAAVNSALTAAGPYVSWAAGLIFLVPSYIIFKKSVSLFASWDGEDEEKPEEIERKLNIVLLLMSISMSVEFFALSLVIFFNCGLGGSVAGLAGFLLYIILMTALQQKAVDLIRKLNPEKEGSMYDVKFQKKWYGSCDEAERKLIGEASYRAYCIGVNTCIVLWLLSVFAHLFFDTGILASVMLLIVLAVMQVSYIVSAMKLSERK